MDNLSFWQYVVLFVRIYAGLCWVSAVGYALAKITCLESLLDLDSMLDFKLPDVMFSRPVKWQDVKE